MPRIAADPAVASGADTTGRLDPAVARRAEVGVVHVAVAEIQPFLPSSTRSG